MKYFHKLRRIIPLTICLILGSQSACSIQVYDLQPVIQISSTPTTYQTPTQFLARTRGPMTMDVTNTPPIHIAPTEIRETVPVNILELVMIDGGAGWGVGQMPGAAEKMIVRTTDGGSNWKNLTPPQAVYENTGRNMEVSAWFLDANNAWILFWETDKWSPQTGVSVWRTSDAGANWEYTLLPVTGYTIQYFRDAQIGFIDSKTGWILAHLGQNQEREYVGLYTTNDGGVSWSVMVSSDSANLPSKGSKTGAVFRSTLEGWISGSNSREEPGSVLWRTVDGGNTWSNQSIPAPEGEGIPADLLSSNAYNCSFDTPSFVDFQFQYAWSVLRCTGNLPEPLAILYWSYDTMASWKSMKLPKADGSLEFYGIYQGWYSQTANPGEGFDHEILFTEDGGVTWRTISLTAWDSKLQFITAAVGFGTVNYQGQTAMVRTSDGGYSWEQVFPMINP